jgi:carbamoyl-phosphate synthase large subunit
MKRIRVMVTGAGGPAGMGTIKSLLGLKDIDVVAADMNPLAAGLYWTAHRVVVPPVGARDFIPRMLGIVKREKIDVIFPTVDEEIEPLAANIEKFKRVTNILISPIGSVRICTDKLATFETCMKLHLPVVETKKIRREKDLNGAADKFGFPLAIKPMVSRGGRGLFYCKDMNELKTRYRELKKKLPFSDTYYEPVASRKIICQEHLPGIEYDVVALRDKKGKIIANVPMRAEEWDVKAQRRTIITEHSREAMTLAGKIMDGFDLHGPVDIEMKKDRNGVLKVLDLNPRVGGDVELATAAGCNIPLLTVRIAMGGKVRHADFTDDYMLIRYLGIQTMKKSDVPLGD